MSEEFDDGDDADERVVPHTLLLSTTEGNCLLNIMFDTFDLCDLRKNSGFPHGLENLEKWEGIFQAGKNRGILNRLEKSGKISQNTGKLKQFQTNVIC